MEFPECPLGVQFSSGGAVVSTAPTKRRCLQGVQLSPLGFAACQSKNCTNQAAGAS